MKKTVCVLLANGSEEMEVVICVDVLRRAGIDVLLAGVGDATPTIAASRGVRIAPDSAWDAAEASRFDAIVIPGGMGGTQVLRRDESVKQAIRDFSEVGKIVAAICAGPLVLQDAGVLDDRTLTCHPGVREELTVGTWVDQPVVRDGHLVTSQAPGTTFAFALTLVEILVDADTARKIAGDMRVAW
ncbi:MAG: DJ-1/PfpI family protein [Kiritimatiellae bacterium]|nr:DJ-1/PfpI family protein [Kiritimatiellia bacterium]MDY0150528.1 DJ-1/PfpI family protein [Kiritimatiellia bacterium]